MSKPHSGYPGEAWEPSEHPRQALIEALLDGGVAGVNSHDRPDVLWKIQRLCEGDPDLQFGLTGVDRMPPGELVDLMAREGGFDADPDLKHGLVMVDPELVIRGCEAIGDRLALAAERGERVLLATGHPSGLPLLYQASGRLLTDHGAKLLRPLEGFTWKQDGRERQIRYMSGVAVYTDRASALHTHSPEPMRRMLEEVTPDLVFADHGFAGAAIEAGIDTASIADVNDPALVVAWRQGRGGPVVVMDDNVQPEAYWPCFQVIASRFSRRAR
ncbi:MAG TPA: phosphatase [Actinomycetota bacterium]|nr:phosphatase [Actinomycetota bacterium]